FGDRRLASEIRNRTMAASFYTNGPADRSIAPPPGAARRNRSRSVRGGHGRDVPQRRRELCEPAQVAPCLPRIDDLLHAERLGGSNGGLHGLEAGLDLGPLLLGIGRGRDDGSIGRV